MPIPDPRYDWLSTREAAIREGVSQSTIGRMIREGKLIAESVERPGGTLLRVRYPRAEDTSNPHQPIEAAPTPEPRQDVSEAIQAAVQPVADALAQERAERQSLASQVVALHRELRDETAKRAAAETRATVESTRATDLAANLERERQRTADLAERAARVEAERDELRRRLDARRWYDPRTW